jgi:hypothetical protein
MPLSTIDTSSISGLGYGFKNRIINGGMQVNQRGGTISASGTVNTYAIDRFAMRTTASSVVVSMEQSTVAPSGFYNSLLCTVTTADSSLTTGDPTTLFQRIEGVNVVDLSWGTASAQPVTISFQVRSSVTGTYGVGVQNDSGNRSYPSTYTINAANTWETKTITLPGDTTGTWNLGITSTALYVFFSLSAASNYQGPANAWAASDYRGTTGQVNWGATLSNTFYITGVQLEAGTVATSFDWRSYGTEFQLCQRYYQTYTFYRTGVTGTGNVGLNSEASFRMQVPMRATPSAATLTTITTLVDGSSVANSNITWTGIDSSTVNLFITITGGSYSNSKILNTGSISASAEL